MGGGGRSPAWRGLRCRATWAAATATSAGAWKRASGKIRLIAYTTRFLILSWVITPHLASHILSRVNGALSKDWQQIYGHAIYFAETFSLAGKVGDAVTGEETDDGEANRV
jgi:hypothetical protein